MKEIPVFVESELEMMPRDLLIQFFMAQQRLNLIQDDSMSQMRKLIELQQEVIEIAGIGK